MDAMQNVSGFVPLKVNDEAVPRVSGFAVEGNLLLDEVVHEDLRTVRVCGVGIKQGE
jgi:hypothetical protein